MEFKEYSNPEEQDYDITSSYGEEEAVINSYNPYEDELLYLIGILEDITDEELMDKYGITMAEYINPTQETIDKVKEAMGIEESQRHLL